MGLQLTSSRKQMELFDGDPMIYPVFSLRNKYL